MKKTRIMDLCRTCSGCMLLEKEDFFNVHFCPWYDGDEPIARQPEEPPKARTVAQTVQINIFFNTPAPQERWRCRR